MQATAQTDPGFKLPEDKNTPDDPLPKTTPGTAATGTMEVTPGAPAAATDTSTRDAVIGGAVFLVLLVAFFFARNTYVHHLVVRRVAPSTAGSAGWMLFVGLAFLAAAAVLAIANASKYLTLGVTGPLVFVGLVSLVAAVFIGRR
ncbi:MAG: hypothetical protein JWQ80_89 [Massilia sp.]|nr:hypothetical protein [Massilia sp.]